MKGGDVVSLGLSTFDDPPQDRSHAGHRASQFPGVLDLLNGEELQDANSLTFDQDGIGTCDSDCGATVEQTFAGRQPTRDIRGKMGLSAGEHSTNQAFAAFHP